MRTSAISRHLTLLGLSISVALSFPACGGDDDADQGAGAKGGASGSGSHAGSGGSGGKASGSGGASGGSDQSSAGAAGHGGETSSGEAGAVANGGEGGSGGASEVLGAGTRFVNAFNDLWLKSCDCLIAAGAYEDLYDCAIGEDYHLLSSYSADCLDALAADSSIAEGYLLCVTETFTGAVDCYQDRGECSNLIGSKIGCPEGGPALRCDGQSECDGGSDEADCPAPFQCDGDTTNVPQGLVCNGTAQCADNADEANCEAVRCPIGDQGPCGLPGEEDKDRVNNCVAL